MDLYEAIEIICNDYCKYPDIESGNKLADICDKCPMNKCEDLRWADRKTEPQYDFGEYADRLWKIAYERGKREALEQTEPTISKMEQVDKDINVSSKDEPQSDARKILGCVCETCKHRDEEWDSEACDGCCENDDHYEPQTMYYPQVDGITPSVIVEDEPQTDCNEALTLLWIKNMVTDEEFYRIDARLKCISCKWWNDTIVGGSECVSKECTYQPKDEPQTDVEIAKAIVHKAIDESDIADEAYPNLRQRLHDAVDAYEPQTERSE